MIGVAIAAIARLPGAAPLQGVVAACEPLGTAFIRLITMVVIPLVVSSLFVGVASLGDVRRLGRVGGRTLLYFLVTTCVAATIGLSLALAAGLGSGVTAAGVHAAAGVESRPDLVQMLVNMVPQNPIASAAQGDLMPLIIAVCIFGAAATVTRSDARRTVTAFFEGIYELSMIVIGWMMRLAPAAVLILITSVVARSGADVLQGLLMFVAIVLAALALHAGVLLAILRIAGGLPIAAFFSSVSDALLLAFSTASSSVALPASMAAARERLRLSDEVVGFVLPSGTTLNKNGAAAYKAVTAVFLAHVYGVALGPIQLLTIVVTSTVGAFAGAGVPGSSLVTTLIVLNAIGLGPNAAAGIALVAGVDRPIDMCRTVVNALGNLVGAVWVSTCIRRRP